MSRFVDRGSGPAVLLIPGIQGRWQFLRPTVEALAARGCRVLTFSLGQPFDRRVPMDAAAGYARDLARIDRLLAEAGVDRVALCGSSAGGPIAVEYAATRPERVTALVLASAAGPRWAPDDRLRRYMRRPWLYGPLFLMGTRARLAPEVRAAIPGRPARMAFSLRQVVTLILAPVSPGRMADRARLMEAVDMTAAARRVRAPALVITGEDGLDRIVPTAGTREYLKLIPDVRSVVLDRTGHLGLVTQPDRFAALVGTFVHAAVQSAERIEGRQTHG
jgi:pimeloyl-ACP methyl ester carboxylesterase